jgi:hypothetical protein
VHEVRGRSVLDCRTVRVGADDPRVLHGHSVIEGAVLVVRELFSNYPPQPRGQSAQSTRTVRPVLADGLPGAAQSCKSFAP